ncbi:MAG TPA: choice-of-anchor tandem repeat GloVer-containing protein [Candidatus Aquilonibacter sp.]|nr:choice-of-anchor tandem repeat GloVer-containing protein [Candidatus Aquilonibacter sp.]
MIKADWWKMTCGMFVLCAATAIAAPAQTFNTLFYFNGPSGGEPDFMTLVQGVDGGFYGTTLLGGNEKACSLGCGTVFRINAEGVLNTLPLIPREGDYPYAGIMLATDGSFYGAAVYGGDNDNGAIFKIARPGGLITLYSFCSLANCADGANPEAPLVEAADGGFYGTTTNGGANGDYGTVFKITAQGTLTTLYSFCAQIYCSDGEEPVGGLVQAWDGNFYGTTFSGGSDGAGTIFKITAQGDFTSLYSFCVQPRCVDGSEPEAGLIQAIDGDFYGTSLAGGVNDEGTVFKVTINGTLITLYSFCAQTNCADGSSPAARLVQANDGNYYGTTAIGGANLLGTVFKISGSGHLTTLHSFDSSDGAQPSGGLLQATEGNFYGTTPLGGPFICDSDGCGTIFSLDVGLSPFVAFVSAAGEIGQTSGILGQGFTGTTSVSLNGIPASFTVVSDSLIRATVPRGATSGYVTVTTPSGTLTSNVPFHVIQ